MADKYEEIETILRGQHAIAQSIRKNMDKNGGDYIL